ncbi:fumarylacetoacetate hydrolase family protein [Shimia sediminis]|uniref:fumarylacetoacetate hydrolase family protein n=1 Tax=Shimia sediminis TaxID=2497945 RepID=UPI000F8C9694|nr:fumarylacetoacetate hydrolase family protein [Shimia sediminis]
MKLVRYGEPGEEKPGLIDENGNIRDLSNVVPDIEGHTLSPEGQEALRSLDAAVLPQVSGSPRLGPCVVNIGRIVCIGLNYSDHAKESGMAEPEEPVIFVKACAATGANDDVTIPLGATKTDWEVELAVIIGRRAQHVREADALEYVAGYAVANDVSERAFQHERGGQWTKGKSCEGFAPLGPWLVTADEVGDPQALRIWLEVNGKRFQDGSTADQIFGVAHVVSYLSRFMVLHPGDVIMTGTPAGVGAGIKPDPVWLKPGDKVRVGIDKLGEQNQRFVAFEDNSKAGA